MFCRLHFLRFSAPSVLFLCNGVFLFFMRRGEEEDLIYASNLALFVFLFFHTQMETDRGTGSPFFRFVIFPPPHDRARACSKIGGGEKKRTSNTKEEVEGRNVRAAKVTSLDRCSFPLPYNGCAGIIWPKTRGPDREEHSGKCSASGARILWPPSFPRPSFSPPLHLEGSFFFFFAMSGSQSTKSEWRRTTE